MYACTTPCHHVKGLIRYFPVKRVMLLPRRACHRVPLFRAAVYGGQARLSVRARWGMAVCGVAQAAPPSRHQALWPGAAGAGPTSAAGHDPRSPWAAQAGSPCETSRWLLPPAPVRAAADDSLEPSRMDGRLPPSAWPSGATRPPASGRASRPAAGHRSTAATCCGGGARQRAAHASARCCRSAPPAAPRRSPQPPQRRRGGSGPLARDGAARWPGGPLRWAPWGGPGLDGGGAGRGRPGRVGAPAHERRAPPLVAPCS